MSLYGSNNIGLSIFVCIYYQYGGIIQSLSYSPTLLEHPEDAWKKGISPIHPEVLASLPGAIYLQRSGGASSEATAGIGASSDPGYLTP